MTVADDTAVQDGDTRNADDKAKRIVILSDGTGNAASSVWRTNVWRIFQSLDLRSNVQVAKYDDGVGTSAFKPLAMLGGAFGWGLKRNVLDAYKFVCRNYQDGTKLYLFGFSRGAFTARVLAGFILNQGLVKTNSEAELHDLAAKAYRAYRAQGYHSILRIEVLFRALRDGFLRLTDWNGKLYSKDDNRPVNEIEFLGLWDTVAAYGLPVDEMTRGVSDWIWPLNLPDRKLSPKVKWARHALALDDERTTFHPVLWTEQSETPQRSLPYSTDNERLVQVWFTGMHANVGGGYPDDALAFVPLYWILEEAKKRGLKFKSDPCADPDTTKWVYAGQDKDGRLYDSRSGLGGYYRYGPRKVFDLCNDTDAGVQVALPKIHESVFGRIDSGANAYAPIGLPQRYAVLTGAGQVSAPTFESTTQAEARHQAQERLWNYVWLRRLVYFATIAATAYIVLFPAFENRNAEHEYESKIRMVSEFVRLIGSFVPDSFKWWVNWYAASPERFAISILVLIGLIVTGTRLQGKIQDAMRQIWRTRGASSPFTMTRVHRLLYWIRTSRPYRGTIWLGRQYVVPFLCALAIIYVVLSGLSHFLFNAFDSMGSYCTKTPIADLKPVPIEGVTIDFNTDSLCAATKHTVMAGYRYEIVIKPDSPWKDGDVVTNPIGFEANSLPFPDSWLYRLQTPLRRLLFRPWSMPAARIGHAGVDEYFLDPVAIPGSSPPAYRANGNILARRSGELFFYVNDKVIGVPGSYAGRFYKTNTGTAKITIRAR